MNYTEVREFDTEVQFEIGQRIQDKRLEKHISTVDLAAYLGIGRNQLSRIENGKANCTLPQLFILAQVLGCSVDYLLFAKKQEQVYSDEQNDAIQKLLNAFGK